ncbi:bifunctional L-myo-inositol-1-phosphate cytidylyltransferase/CDP-L-myo-inositol myo-inositolphosphotransferase [Archaeoglobus neptunius]|uniref:bifunctional L-myo-inositol-1-phosphate cytidylyltransferase/CDP-L-myo-inositol myo-inositolphosphotransferase n=1 Tax=Archaeoglobus neptunius TaxID=2798580 RepID=UPI00192652FF|nr:bifunctional L-myo-inositol-1-phosphate cytidylyltransferase/CDP-L-myo-inositol myo-inositolphosphotransferase [Archaeoglobus neptunius]
MKAVILAAGLGTRLGGVPKPLVKVGGQEILLRTMKLLSPYVSEFVIVSSVYAERINEFLRDKGFKYTIVKNESPERGNGYSLLISKDFVDRDFILVMGDHIYSREFIEEAVKGRGLIADRSPRFVEIKEATKVKVDGGRIEDIGKELETFDCVDTGFFILDTSIFNVADELKELNEIPLSEVVKRARLPVSYVDGRLWMDVDTKEDVRKANRLLIKTAVKGEGDGFISRHLNRKISTEISAMVVNRLNPSHMTVISFLTGIISSLFLFFNVPLAGFMYQFSSVLDGCDGEIARASMRTSKKGGYADSILDRFVDFLFLAILAILYPENLQIGLFAIFGSIMVSYSTEKYKAEYGESIYRKIKKMRYLPGKRDERIFLIMIFCLLAYFGKFWIQLMFWSIAVLSILRVLATLLIVVKS